MSICNRLTLAAAAVAAALTAAAADLANAEAPAAVVHPAGPFKAADLERARANVARYEWAQKLLAGYRERAKILMAIPSDRIAAAIPAEDPWLQCPCPKCGTHADYAWRNGLRPDGESAACAKCGQVIPSPDFPEDRVYQAKNLRGEVRLIPYHKGAEPYYGNRRQFLGGLINWLKVSRLYKLTDLAYVYALTGERPYAERTRELLLRFAETYPGYVVRFRTTAFDSPAANYMASHFADWKYQDSVLVANLALAYDLTVSSGLYRDADRLKIENGIFREYGRLITAHAPTRDWCSNAVPAHLTGAALAGAMLGNHRLMSWVLEGKEGFKSFVAANYHRDGNWNENSPSYAVMANEPWWRLLETLNGFSDSPDYRGAGRYDKIDVFAEIPLSRYLFGALDRAVMPDGALPPNNDSAFGLTLPLQWRDFAASHFGAPPPVEAGTEYALFKRGNAASGAPPPQTSSVLAGPNWAILRPPAASGRTALMLNFGPFVGGHAHDSALSYTYYDFGRELVTDLGYLGYTHPLRPWMISAAAHNQVIVDGAMQSEKRAPHLDFCADGGSFQAVSASSPESFPGVTTDYRRTLLLVGDEQGQSYLVDFFQVKGGRDHLLPFHADGAEFTPPALESKAAELAAGDGAKNGLKHLAAVRSFEAPPGVHRAVWRSGKLATSLYLVLEKPETLFAATAPGTRRQADPFDTKTRLSLLLRRAAGPESIFVSVLEADDGSPRIAAVRPLELASGEGRALEIERCGGDVDLVALNTGVAAVTLRRYPGFRLDGRLGAVRLRDGRPLRLFAAGEGGIRFDDAVLTLPESSAGKIVAVDPAARTVELPTPPPPEVAGQFLLAPDHADGIYRVVAVDAKTLTLADDGELRLAPGDRYRIVCHGEK